MSSCFYSSHLDTLVHDNAACAGSHKPPTTAKSIQRKRPSGGVPGRPIIGPTSAEVVFADLWGQRVNQISGIWLQGFGVGVGFSAFTYYNFGRGVQL